MPAPTITVWARVGRSATSTMMQHGVADATPRLRESQLCPRQTGEELALTIRPPATSTAIRPSTPTSSHRPFALHAGTRESPLEDVTSLPVATSFRYRPVSRSVTPTPSPEDATSVPSGDHCRRVPHDSEKIRGSVPSASMTERSHATIPLPPPLVTPNSSAIARRDPSGDHAT